MGVQKKKNFSGGGSVRFNVLLEAGSDDIAERRIQVIRI